MNDIVGTLKERDSQYGTYIDQAAISQDIKAAMQKGRRWGELAPDQRETLDLIANKIARILNGNPDFHDSWFDIQGYAKLVADRLAK